MFSLKNFILTTIEGMIGKEPDYKVRQYAIAWYDKGVLTEDDLAEIETKIEALYESSEAENQTETEVVEEVTTEESESVSESTDEATSEFEY